MHVRWIPSSEKAGTARLRFTFTCRPVAVASEGRRRMARRTRRTNRSACGRATSPRGPSGQRHGIGRSAGRRGSWARCDANRTWDGDKKKVAWLAKTGRNAIAMPAGACMRIADITRGKKRLKKGDGSAHLCSLLCEGMHAVEWPYLSTTTSILYLPPLSSPAGSFFVFTAAPSEARAASDSCESVKEYMTRFHSCYITLVGRA